MKKFIKLSDWAKNNSYTYRGAFGAFKNGKIKGAKQLESGAIVVEVEELIIQEGRVSDQWKKELAALSDSLDKLSQLTKTLIEMI